MGGWRTLSQPDIGEEYLAETAQIAFIRHGWTVPVFKSSKKAGPFRNSHLELEETFRDHTVGN